MKTQTENVSGHTPGPWDYREAYDNGEPCGYVVQKGPAFAIADVPQGEDDARLIAAAPDLLAACERALQHIEEYDESSRGGDYREATRTLRAAIAKAKGKLL